MSNYVITASPHIRNKINTAFLMNMVSISLLPATIGGIVIFGWTNTLPLIALSIISAVVSEALFQKLLKLPMSYLDGSAIVTGFLLALCCPPGIPLWLPVIGSFFAIFSKQVFGGLGHNPFNPALIGRAFLVLSFPAHMTSWLKPFDVVTTSTPLAVFSEKGMSGVLGLFQGSVSTMHKSMFWGIRGGCIGEVFILGLLLGLALLLLTKTIQWYVPVTYMGTVFLVSWMLGMDPIFSILSGGVMFGAFFMATDYVTSPMLPQSKIIYGFGCGFINVMIRFFANMPEGTTFAILLMNVITPMLDNRIKKPVGFVKEKTS
ncbi:MAG: RnfABCDGE type electron transport complex subunit D [Caldisericia bacterium]|nr:RnfABCDGE type electron transport complex subunit D [Caldisericia bacterium]MDD4614466.1 RnfABCDGE type electron transport complex subunit D [Caldisericia bacterium]